MEHKSKIFIKIPQPSNNWFFDKELNVKICVKSDTIYIAQVNI
jgi:hypothetical protein